MTTRLQKNVKQYFKDNIGIIGALLILCIFLSVFPKTSGSFLTQKNIFNVLRQISSNLFLACGMTMVIILGGIDLSVGSIIALSGCFAAGCVSRYGLPIAVGVLGGVLVGTVVGMFNGVVISKTTIPPFIVTLATMNVAKGLEPETLFLLSDVIKREAPQCEVCVLSGPSHAEEVARKVPTACLIACENEAVAKLVQEEFANPRFRLYTNTDLIGVEIGAALKNVMALAAGMSDGLGFGDNTKAALMTRGMAEMKRLGMAMGGKAETFAGLSGIGDLIVTCTSMHSRNRRAGILLGQGKSLQETLDEVKMVVEGVNTVQAACQLAEKYHVSMPITQSIYAVLFERKNVEDAVLELMTRDNKAE